MSFFSSIGDAVSEAAKVATGAIETVVQVTPIGKVAESIGIHVDENIHDNGFNASVSGTAARMVTLGAADKVEAKIKVKAKGGDFGAKGAGDVKDGDVSIAHVDGGVDSKGIYGNASVGAMVNSGFIEINTSTDINKICFELMEKLSSTKYATLPKLIKEATGHDFNTLVRNVLDEFVKNLPFNLTEMVLKLKGDKAKIYVDVGGSTTVGVGATFKSGMDTEVTVDKKTSTFKMYNMGGSFTVVAGISAGLGYSKTGKTFDGYEEGIYLQASVSSGTFSASIGLIVTANVGCEVYNQVKKVLEEGLLSTLPQV